MSAARPSITTRLALLFGAVSAIAFLALGTYLSSALEMHFAMMDRETLDAHAQRIARQFQRAVGSGPSAGVQARLDALLASHDRVAYWIDAPDGRTIAVDAPVALPSRPIGDGRLDHPGHEGLFVWEDGGVRYRGLAFALTGADGQPLRGTVALSIDDHEQFMVVFRRAMWLAVFGAILSATLLGVLVARGGLRPVRELTALAHRVSTERLGERLRTEDAPRELYELTVAFNDMLARLDDAFRRLSNFSSDIAHELRTPLSNLLTETQVTLSRTRSVDEYADVLASNAEELERLARMVSDMLFIAKAENGLVLPSAEQVSLGVEIRKLLEFFEPVAEERAVQVSLAGQAAVVGDRRLLAQAVGNLISNAIRHTPSGGTVRVILTEQDGLATVCVSNPGKPIAKDDQARLFDRFFRADASRTRNGEGAGLGLAIARAIVLAHHGRIEVSSDAQQTRFSIHLPTGEPPS